MAIDFDLPIRKALTAKQLAIVKNLFDRRAALFFTPTANIPASLVGNGSLDVRIPWSLPNWTTCMNNQAYRMPKFWVDAIQVATGKIRWIPNFPAKVTLYAYYEIDPMDMAIGGKALIDALKESTYGRRDGKLLHYFGAIKDDSPEHIQFEAIVDKNERALSGLTRLTIEPLKTIDPNAPTSWSRR